MECKQRQSTVAVTKTLHEDFIEEKCECDLLIPDYFSAAEKIIQCSATPVILKKEFEGDRLLLEGVCRFFVIYQGEEAAGIKVLSESVNFSESVAVKEATYESRVQAIARVSGVSCRLLNSRKVNARAFISIALKVKDQSNTEIIETMDDCQVEALFCEKNVHTILEHISDTTKVQGEIETHTEIQDILRTDGTVCIKDIKMLGNKAMLKGILNLYVLFTPEEDPCRVEQTSTAIPFSQLIEFNTSDEDAMVEAVCTIQNIRNDVETDADGKNKIISVAATLLTEGEVFADKKHHFLTDAYSTKYPIEPTYGDITFESMVEQSECVESIRFEIGLEGDDARVVQMIGSPIIKKVTAQGKTLTLEGVLDVSMFIQEGDAYRNVDKSFPFTISKELHRIGDYMRCEVCPCLLGLDHISSEKNTEIKADIQCHFSIFTKETCNVIKDLVVDSDHPLEVAPSSNVVVYFGEKGERIWDIARHYSTSMANIKEINGLDEDVLEEKKLLLISK